MRRFPRHMEFFMRSRITSNYFFTPDLKFTQATHYILNYQKMNKDQIFRVEAYYKIYKNLVKTVPIGL